MKALSFNNKRIIVALALLVTLFCVANYYLNLGFFGQFARKMVVVSFTVLGVAVLYFGPTLREVQEYRDKRRMQMK